MVLAKSWTHKDCLEFTSHIYADILLQYLFAVFHPEQHSFLQWQNYCVVILTPRIKKQHKEGCSGIEELEQVLETSLIELEK